MRKKRIKLQLDPQVEAHLQHLGIWYGYTTTALIRACIDLALPKLEEFLDQQNTQKAAKKADPSS
jgi:hypothetical protein